MNAAVLTAVKRVEVKSVPDPRMGPGDVLIQMSHTGACGSDLHAFVGLHPFRKPPVILGHEIAGRVTAVGEAARAEADRRGLRVGEMVTVLPCLPCGGCEVCRRGLTNVCPTKRVPGMAGWEGSFAEFFAAPASLVYPLPAGMPPEVGVLAEPLAVGIRAAGRGCVGPGSEVLILGGGTIGILTAAAARAAGAAGIYVSDLYPFNLRLAEEIAGAVGLDAGNPGLVSLLKSRVPEGFDAVFLCAHAEATVRQGLAAVRRGGRVVVVGMFLEPIPFKLIDVSFPEIDLVGSQIYTAADFQAALDALAKLDLPLDRVVTHVLPLVEAGRGLSMLADHGENAVKVLFTP